MHREQVLGRAVHLVDHSKGFKAVEGTAAAAAANGLPAGAVM